MSKEHNTRKAVPRRMAKILHGEESKHRSIIIPFRMATMPVPGRFQDGAQVGVARSPAEFALHLLGRRNQRRRIAGTARPHLDRHGLARYLLCQTNDLTHAVAAA